MALGLSLLMMLMWWLLSSSTCSTLWHQVALALTDLQLTHYSIAQGNIWCLLVIVYICNHGLRCCMRLDSSTIVRSCELHYCTIDHTFGAAVTASARSVQHANGTVHNDQRVPLNACLFDKWQCLCVRLRALYKQQATMSCTCHNSHSAYAWTARFTGCNIQ
jgi:hypothetical protein